MRWLGCRNTRQASKRPRQDFHQLVGPRDQRDTPLGTCHGGREPAGRCLFQLRLHYFTLAPVQAVLKPQPQALRSIRDTVFRTEFLYDDAGRPIRLSGQDPDIRDDVLRMLVHRLARPRRDGSAGPLQRELAQIADERRRRALLLVGSYREASVAADCLDEIPRWRGRVRVLVAYDAELDAAVEGESSAAPQGPRTGAVRRGDLASFADDPDAELLVALCWPSNADTTSSRHRSAQARSG